MTDSEIVEAAWKDARSLRFWASKEKNRKKAADMRREATRADWACIDAVARINGGGN